MAQKALEPGGEAVVVGLRLPPSQARRLDELAALRGQNRSRVARAAIDRGLDKLELEPVPPPTVDTCPAGHPYDETNTLLWGRGWRKCRTCHRARERRRYAAKRSATADTEEVATATA